MCHTSAASNCRGAGMSAAFPRGVPPSTHAEIVAARAAGKVALRMTLKGAAKNITCPTLITYGDKDTLMSVDGAKRLFAEIGAKDKTLKIYTEEDGGGRIHCSHDYWAHNVPYMLDWLEKRL